MIKAFFKIFNATSFFIFVSSAKTTLPKFPLPKTVIRRKSLTWYWRLLEGSWNSFDFDKMEDSLFNLIWWNCLERSGSNDAILACFIDGFLWTGGRFFKYLTISILSSFSEFSIFFESLLNSEILNNFRMSFGTSQWAGI